MPKITIQYAKDCIRELINMAEDSGEFLSGELNALNLSIHDLNQAIEQERGEYIENDATIEALNAAARFIEREGNDDVVEFIEEYYKNDPQFDGLSDLTSDPDKYTDDSNHSYHIVEDREYDDGRSEWPDMQNQTQDSPAEVIVSESGGVLSTLASIFCCFCIYVAQANPMNGCMSGKVDDYYDI